MIWFPSGTSDIGKIFFLRWHIINLFNKELLLTYLYNYST